MKTEMPTLDGFATARPPFRPVAGSALIVLFLVSAGASAQRREPVPSPFAPLGIQRMSELATQVVAGSIEKMESTWNHDHSRIYTRVTMRVERVLSGQAGRRIVFRIPGGTVGDTTVMVSEMPHFRVGEDDRRLPARDPGRLPSVLGGVPKGRCRFPARTMGASACCSRSRLQRTAVPAERLTNSTIWRTSSAATPSGDRA